VPTASSACLQADTCDVVPGAWGVQAAAAAAAGVTFADMLRSPVGRVESREKKFSYEEIKFSIINIPNKH